MVLRKHKITKLLLIEKLKYELLFTHLYVRILGSKSDFRLSNVLGRFAVHLLRSSSSNEQPKGHTYSACSACCVCNPTCRPDDGPFPFFYFADSIITSLLSMKSAKTLHTTHADVHQTFSNVIHRPAPHGYRPVQSLCASRVRSTTTFPRH